jgi:predicted MFS family arabinose efflux permease
MVSRQPQPTERAVTDEALPTVPSGFTKPVIITVLGALQILSWGSSFYLPAVIARPIAQDTGWPYAWVVAGLSVGLLMAGLVSPRIGRAIALHGGRPVLATGSALLALGLIIIGTAQNYVWYFAGWATLGAGMGAGLYDAAFATLGAIYGKEARGAITAVTLFGGFASTVCWPLSAYLVEHFGWRSTCFVYAGIHVALALPLYIGVLPRRGRATADPGEIGASTAASTALHREERMLFGMLAAVLTIAAAILSMMGAQLVTLLQARGLDINAAVALGMLIGPSAVGARLIEMLAGNHYHPIWTMIASATLVAVGACLFLFGSLGFAPAIILYGAGNGIGSIAKGTLPLALFGPARYPALVGRLALPVMIAMALSPYLGAVAFQHGGATWTFALLLGLAFTNVALVSALWALSQRSRRPL